ncbi:MAG: hypothetical protein KDE53_34105 [Caldilineaceae bacterium]|nr:hypothetical protein [Caldilineaceae bacterium]
MRRSIDPTTRRQLRAILAQFYPDASSIRRVAADAGLDLSRVPLNNHSTNDWHRVLDEAEFANQLAGLLNVVEEEYGVNADFQRICDTYRQATKQIAHEELVSDIERGGDQLADVLDLCACVDAVANAYVSTMLEAEDVLQAWNYRLGRQYSDSDEYGYELLIVSVETWENILQFTRNKSNWTELGYSFEHFAIGSHFKVRTNYNTHAEIAPKFYNGANGWDQEYITLLYIAPNYDESFQRQVGPYGLWTVDYTRKWFLKNLLPRLEYHYAKDDLELVANPKVFWHINESHLFTHHVRLIHRWLYHLDVHIPTNLFVDFCAAFNKLIEYAKLLDKQDSWGYILNRLPMVERNSASYSKFNKRELQDILAENLECLRKIEHVAADDFEFIFRGYISLIETCGITSTQSAINDFKRALWPLYEKASFEYRFIYVE